MMAQKRKRRQFTAEYKTEAVKRSEESGKSLQQVPDELGIHANQLRIWRNEQLAAGLVEGLAKQKAETAELVWLRRDVKRIERGNEILKRAAAFLPRRQYRNEVPVRRRRAGEPFCASVMPGRRHSGERVLRLAAPRAG